MEDQGTPEVTEDMDDFMSSAFDELETQDAPAEESTAVEASEGIPEPKTDTSETAEEKESDDAEPAETQTITAPQSM